MLLAVMLVAGTGLLAALAATRGVPGSAGAASEVDQLRREAAHANDQLGAARHEAAAARRALEEAEAKLASAVGAQGRLEATEAEKAAAPPVPPAPSAHCTWTKQPGTTLGARCEQSWRLCAREGGRCACSGEVRFGAGKKFVYREGSDAPRDCSSAGFHTDDPVPGMVKVCECREPDLASGSLADVQEQCTKLGAACKGVTCEEGEDSGCSSRQGVPYLAAADGKVSWTKDCSGPAALPGGGLRGKHLIEGEPTIFVSMAAFRDRDAHFTLRDMFKKARVPRRIFVGVVCQKYPEDPDCIPAEWDCSLNHTFCGTDQVRVRTFHASEAKGPTHARALAAAMYRGEDFFMMMDAHNRFVTDWDMRLLQEIRNCRSEKCVLSVYPQGLNNSDPENPHPLYTRPGTSMDDFTSVSYLCGGEFHDRAIIKNQRAATVAMSTEPRPQPYTGAGLVFGPGRMIIECPFDPHLPFLWDGEEFLYTARLWTWGYDLFSPSANILFHHYYREGAPRVWGEKSWAKGQGSREQGLAYQRLQLILKAPKRGTDELMVDPETADPRVTQELPKYGLGPVRTIEEYWRFARIDIKNRAGDPRKGEHRGYFCTKFASSQGPFVVEPAE